MKSDIIFYTSTYLMVSLSDTGFPDTTHSKVRQFEFDQFDIFQGISFPDTAHFLPNIRHVKVNNGSEFDI